MNDETQSLTPLMRQYHEIKNRFPDALILFQVGDFYELFNDDAIKAAAFLGITLTKRSNGAHDSPLAGVPVHTIDHYLLKLVRGGFKVVVCDQLTKPQPGKLVERGVKQVLTPGTLTDLKMLQEKSASYVAALFPTAYVYGLAFVELLTGQVFITVVDAKDEKLIEAELSRFLPDEIILPDTKAGRDVYDKIKRMGYLASFGSYNLDVEEQVKEWVKSVAEAVATFMERSEIVLSVLVLLYRFLRTNCEAALSQCTNFFLYSPEDYVLLDAATQRNLELVKNLHDGSNEHTLFNVLDNASTSMGSRQIKKWLLRPLVKREQVEARLDAVGLLYSSLSLREQVEDVLKSVGDLERIVGRIALGRALINDYVGLMRAVSLFPRIEMLCGELPPSSVIHAIKARLVDYAPLVDLLSRSLNEDASAPWLIKPEFDAEFDRLRGLLENGSQALLALEQQEIKATGIPNLKIRFHKSWGYAVEVTKSYLESVPSRYMRLQTLTNRERYTTQELKDLEYDIQRARTSIEEIEQELFAGIKKYVESFCASLKKTAQALAHLDALYSFASVAYARNYTRPTFNDARDLIIKQGRHPVVEAASQNSFIPNDSMLCDDERLWVITGPNMGGKSTFLRQTALISIMAQSGSFVPATSASLALVDRIFTRIGAADNVAAGKSTFLVEMEEVALICNQATSKSLVILDEVGRGTSTYDGMALAQAICEYIYEHIKARCLFATHYHEITDLSETLPGVVTYYAASKETQDGIVLLHKIIKGTAGGSFGLEVAKRAGVPKAIINRADFIVQNLKLHEHKKNDAAHDYTIPATRCEPCDQEHSCISDLSGIDLDALSPREAWQILNNLKNKHQTSQ